MEFQVLARKAVIPGKVCPRLEKPAGIAGIAQIMWRLTVR